MRFSLPILLAVISTSLIFISGCSQQPKPAPKVIIDTSLPVVSLNGHISEMTSIAFEWKSIQDPRVEGYYVYRSDPKAADEKLERIANIKGRYVTHFVDSALQPNTLYMYRFSSYNTQGAESQGSATYRAATLPLLQSVSFFASLGNLPRSAKLIWRPHTDTQIKGYYLERKLKEQTEWKRVATINERLMAEYIDTDLKDAQSYQYRLFAYTHAGIVSTASDVVTVVTKPLPDPITNIKATSQLPRKIIISWDPSIRENFTHYNLYRADEPEGQYRYHVKLTETSFTDIIEEDGAHYFYKVSAVDGDGLESLIETAPTRGSTLAKPKTPLSLSAQIRAHTVQLRWQKADDETQSYVLMKTRKTGWLSKSVTEIKDIQSEQYSDHDLQPDSAYLYQIASVNQYGIRSELSEPVTVITEAN
ncbi:MAG: fibronectin type III domain-containing protein [Campylobacterales bacterium]|nr:fibronectin type III domain-containing protein [Campylobacterales bacterium]